MGMFTSITTAGSGLTAERMRLDVIADNIANVNTTRTTEGGPYRRSRVIFAPRVAEPYWRSPFLPTFLKDRIGEGVRVTAIQKDTASEPRLVYDPTHPDANADGYVAMPNVDVITEMVDLMSAQRAYEANLTTVESVKQMVSKALDI
jgi:flagellar basal-body rod protein FlgC